MRPRDTAASQRNTTFFEGADQCPDYGMSVRTTIDLPGDLHAALRQRAAAAHTSIRLLITAAIESGIRAPRGSLFFCRFTQLGLLRLLATSSITGGDVRTIGEAWTVCDRWLEDSRIGIRDDSFGLDAGFRAPTHPVASHDSPKALGDCYLLAVCQIADTTLVTFDRGLASACRNIRRPVTLLD